MVVHTILLIAGIICLVAAIVLVLWPRWVAAVPAFLGLLLMHLSYYIAVPVLTFVFWGIATLITVGLFYLSPEGEPDGNRSSNLYVGFTAMAGGMLGILLAPRLLVLGVVLGAAMGQLAYSRTPAGKWMLNPSSMFWRYFAAKCLPAIVAVSIVCIAVMGVVID
ncbi:MAG: hypothetical protein IJK93_07005 [Muribaculaceae bacterium]|jgi:hypothetical protein|nr:hypothetical protein [Muribaculaceae bacterium]